VAGDIDVGALAGLMAQRPRSLAVFDIREAGEAEQGHLPFATFLPRRLIEWRIGELVPSTAQDIVVYDDGAGDGRAAFAAATLGEFGYRAVRVLTGGLGAWRAAGRPVATGVNVPSKRFGEEILEHDGVKSIDADRLAQMQAAGETFEQWDVRTPAEFGRATLPGSRNVPGVEIAGRAVEAARDGRLVVVHCAGRTRGVIAAATLALLGVKRVVTLENGTMGWRLSGRSLVPGERSGASSDGDAAVDGAVANALADASGVLRLAPAEVRHRASRQVSEPVILVDVRSEEAYLAGHIASSCSRPGGQLIQCTDEVLAVEAVPVILVDDGNGRAVLAAHWLRRMGFPEVALLEGGIPAWRAAGLPLARGPAAIPTWLTGLRDRVPSIAPNRLDGTSRIVLDVGTSRDFKKGHIPGARWLPRGWLEARLGEIEHHDREMVVTAADESQAILAAATLLRLGHSAKWLAGGNAGWVVQGGTLEPTEDIALDLPPDVVDPPYLKGEAGMRAYLEWEIALTER